MPSLGLLCLAACYSPPDAADTQTTALDTTSDGSTGTADPTSDPTTGSAATSTADTSDDTSTGAADPTDGGDTTTGTTSTETGGDPVGCDGSQQFTQIVLMEELATTDDEGSASLTSDELTLYYFSNVQNPGTPDLDAYVSTRDSIDAPFGAPARLDAVSSGSDDRGGWITADALAFYFYSSRDAGYELWVSARDNVAAPLGPPEKLGPAINTPSIEQGPYVTPDGGTLYFTRDSALYRAQLGADGFEQPSPVGELNGGDVASPVLSPDGTTIYFASSRPGGAGDLDIWQATRSRPDDTFGEPTNVAELNLDDFEFPEWISEDGCRLYFTSRRRDGAGGWDMWIASRE